MTAATSATYGFARGFDDYQELDAELEPRERRMRSHPVYEAPSVVEAALEWIEGPQRDPQRPFFMYLHTIDPHMPMRTHPGYTAFTGDYDGPLDGSVEIMSSSKRAGYEFTPEDIAHVQDLYDGEVLFNDAWLGRFTDALEAAGLLDDTLLVIVSDHGEELFDRGRHGHGHDNLQAELVQVPLVLRWPAGLPGGVRVPDLVRGIDVLPTLLLLADLPQIPDVDGSSVAHLVDDRFEAGAAPRDPGLVLADRAKEPDDVAALRSLESLYVRKTEAFGGGQEFYDLTVDPRALENQFDPESEEIAALRDRLDAWQVYRRVVESRLGSGSEIEMTAELKAKLESLGYLDADADEPTDGD